LVKKETFISKNFTTFFGHPISDGWVPMEDNIWRKNIDPNDIDLITKDQYAVLSSDASDNKWVGEYRLKKADGTYAIVKDKTFAIKDEAGNIVRMVGAMQDITQQREEEERLRLMESVIVNINDAILVTEAEPFDLPGPRILFVNKAFTEMTGYTAEEVIGKTPRILQNEETDRKELDRVAKSLKNWESCEATVRNSRKNGEKFWLNMQITPIANDQGWYTHWIAVERDVTKQIEAAQEMETLQKELVETNLELKQFSYITTHNLRAPLTNLLSICEIIQPEAGTDELTLQLIDWFKTSTYHLNETLNDLIEILIIKENRNIQKDQLTFDEIFKKITESLSRSLLEKKAIINADFSAAPSVIFANIYLESVFLNLLTNAVKYCHPDRDPVITVKTTKEPNGDTKLTFSDNGIGINMALAKDKIFGLYKRFHSNTNSKGIGLYLVHSQLTSLGAKIEVESEVNIGTTFTIIFK
jgi:PAS domain S-box-containing protein